MKTQNISIKRILQACIFTCIISCTINAAEHEELWGESGCGCNSVLIYILTSGDYPQNKEAQDAAWESFKGTYGFSDTDRLGNRTEFYNCHSYIYYSSYGWITDVGSFWGSSSGCWEYDTYGSIFSDWGHSCLVSNNTGKCGSLFLCKNNQLVYGPSMPTGRYGQN